MKSALPLTMIPLLFLVCCRLPETPAGAGTEYAAVSRVDSGKAVSVMLTAYRTTLIADGKDHTLLRLAVTDSAGREIRSAADTIRIYVSGDALLTGTEGQSLPMATDTAGVEYYVQTLVNGQGKIHFVAGTTPGKIQVEARASGLWPGSHEIHTLPSDFVHMTPRSDQLKQSSTQAGKMIGADVSFLPQLEAGGRKFFENGVQKDPLQIMAGHGFNYIRLRIFVHPEAEGGYSEEGFCGLEQTLKMAKQIREAGMKLLLNFHYSDYWADPQRQNKPLAWKNLDFPALKDSVKQYTVRVLEALKAQGTPPGMVQVGNEINHGILWPEGHISNPDRLAQLLKAGTEGVKKVFPEVPVMMHVALGGQHEEAVFWFDNMMARGVEFDVMGLSYYPRWHGTLDDLKYNLTRLAERYRKPVNVVEYGAYAREIHEIVFSLPNGPGNGTCAWEPIGFRGGGLFDRNGEVTGQMLLYDTLSRQYLGK
ncbi:MAG TPA: hypothetical protein ENF21_03205 [Bacteroidetes bacterium]|nr:hypothetical protein [Bacteroidota bacterium]